MKEIYVYISGFDIFHKDSHFIAKNYKDYCNKKGFIPLHPLDNDFDNLTSKDLIIKYIVNNNLKYINKSNFVIANLNNYKGYEPDSGTVFEIGYAFAKGKKIIGYRNNNLINLNKENDILTYFENFKDNFSENINIMIKENIILIEGSFYDAVDYIENLINEKN